MRGTSVVCEEAAASETIFVSAMNICPAVAGKLVAAHERGVFVCAIYSKFQSDRAWVTSLQALLDAGMHDVVTSKVLLHQKLFYTTQRGLWIGSSNFTTQAFASNVDESLTRVGEASILPVLHWNHNSNCLISRQ